MSYLLECMVSGKTRAQAPLDPSRPDIEVTRGNALDPGAIDDLGVSAVEHEVGVFRFWPLVDRRDQVSGIGRHWVVEWVAAIVPEVHVLRREVDLDPVDADIGQVV